MTTIGELEILDSYSGRGETKRVVLKDTTLYFSYNTLVGIEHRGELFVIKNLWGTTTGIHLSAIDGNSKEARDKRLSLEDFMAKARELGLME